MRKLLLLQIVLGRDSQLRPGPGNPFAEARSVSNRVQLAQLVPAALLLVVLLAAAAEVSGSPYKPPAAAEDADSDWRKPRNEFAQANNAWRMEVPSAAKNAKGFLEGHHGVYSTDCNPIGVGIGASVNTQAVWSEGDTLYWKPALADSAEQYRHGRKLMRYKRISKQEDAPLTNGLRGVIYRIENEEEKFDLFVTFGLIVVLPVSDSGGRSSMYLLCRPAGRIATPAKGSDVERRSLSIAMLRLVQASSGDLALIALRAGADPNIDVGDGRTALHAAAWNGLAQVARHLLARGAKIDAIDPKRNTPLVLAVFTAHTETVGVLLAAGADPTASGTNSSDERKPLISLSPSYNTDVLKLLVQWGADPNARTQDSEEGERLIHAAARKGDIELVELLIDKGADTSSPNRAGKTPLQIAGARNFEVVKLLATTKPEFEPLLDDLLSRGLTIWPEKDGKTDDEAPTYMDMKKILVVARMALKFGISADRIGAGDNGFFQILRGTIDKGDLRLLDLLLKHGLDPSVMESLLDSAIWDGEAKIIRGLLDRGAVGGTDEGMLHSAAWSLYPESVSIVLATGIDPNVQDSSGGTPLMSAAATELQFVWRPEQEGGAAEILKALEQSQIEIAQILVRAGADVNLENQFGETPLMFAVNAGNERLAKYLIEEGADPKAKSQFGVSVSDLRRPRRKAVKFENEYDFGWSEDAWGLTEDAWRSLRAAVWAASSAEEARRLVSETPGGAGHLLAVGLQESNLDRIRLGIGAGASPDAPVPDMSGALSPPLLNAMQHEPEIALLLLDLGASVDVRDYLGNQATHMLVLNGLLEGDTARAGREILAKLLEGGADLNAKNDWGHTPIILAAQSLQDDVVVMLKEAGADGSLIPKKKYSRGYRRRVGVTIGIDDYKYWPPLEAGVGDAKRVAAELRNLGFDEVIEVHNGDATRERILSILQQDLMTSTKPDDLVVFFYAGHGQTARSNTGAKVGYIIPVEGSIANLDDSISMKELRQVAMKLPAKHVYFAMDSCYSGLGLNRGISLNRLQGGYLDKLTLHRAVQVLTAGMENEDAVEEGGEGLFTSYFLRALRGEADFDGDGAVTAGEIGAFVRPRVSKASQHKQTPMYGSLIGSGEIVFQR